MNNLDGENGPNLTHGPERHPRHPRPRALRLQLRRAAHGRRASRSAGSPTTTSCCWSCIALRHPGLHPAQQQPDRPRLGGHPRGREGRRGHGRQRLRAEALRLRQRRVPGRRRRHGQGPPGRLGHARTSTSSWSPRSCSRPSCSAAWAPCSACCSAATILQAVPEKLRLLQRLPAADLRPAARSS